MDEGYVMQRYEESGEYHLYKAHYDSNGQIIVKPKTPLCGDNDVRHDSRYELVNDEILDEDKMARLCANQKRAARHVICANCVGHFYKTK